MHSQTIGFKGEVSCVCIHVECRKCTKVQYNKNTKYVYFFTIKNNVSLC